MRIFVLTALDELQALPKLVAIALLIKQVRLQSLSYIQRFQIAFAKLGKCLVSSESRVNKVRGKSFHWPKRDNKSVSKKEYKTDFFFFFSDFIHLQQRGDTEFRTWVSVFLSPHLDETCH